MLFLAVLGATLALVALLQPIIKRAPVMLYLIAAALDVLYLAAIMGWLSPAWNSFAVITVRRGLAAVALFVIVMYIGVLSHGSAPRRFFGRIRADLAIAGCILIAGHVISYGVQYLGRLITGQLGSAALALSFIFGVILVALTVVLGITSFRRVRRAMDATLWLRIQRWAYVFYGLLWAHAALLLLPSALAGLSTATLNLVIYTAVFGIYAILRVARAAADRRTLAEVSRLREDELSTQLQA